MSEEPKKVFISYSHDSQAHAERVRRLADRLRADGIDCILDQYEPAPAEGWPRWMRRQVEEADYVLVVSTETYYRRATGREQLGRGLGSQFESSLILQALHDAGMSNEKFIPILLEGSSRKHIPEPLRPFAHYQPCSEDGYEGLYRLLTQQPLVPKPPLGPAKTLPPRERRDFLSPQFPNEHVRGLSQALEEAYRELEGLESSGRDATAVREEILNLRREIRDGVHLQPGDLLQGRFKLIKVVGQGGFATVWKAYDKKRCELVAVKVLHNQYAQDNTRRERFFRGARQMARLQHLGIVKVYEEECQDEGYCFFVMEFVAGGDLKQVIMKDSLTLRERLRIILAVGDALHFAHQQGVIHRDIKPANILLDLKANPKLTDFDLVRAIDTTGGTRTGMLGTVIYAAPEVMEKAKEADERADVYALGMTAVFALHGSDLNLNVLRDAGTFVRTLEVSDGCRDTLHRAVAWDLEERWPKVQDFCDALRREFQQSRMEQKSSVTDSASAAVPSVKVAPASPESANHEIDKRRIAVLLTILAALVVAKLTATWLQGSGEPSNDVSLTVVTFDLETRENEIVDYARSLADGGNLTVAVEVMRRGMREYPWSVRLPRAYLELPAPEEEDILEVYIRERMAAAEAWISAREYENAFDLLERVLLVDPGHERARQRAEDLQRFLTHMREPPPRPRASPPPPSSSAPPPRAAPPPSRRPPAQGEVVLIFRSMVGEGKLTVFAGDLRMVSQDFDFPDRRLFKKKYLKDEASFEKTFSLDAGVGALLVKVEAEVKEGRKSLTGGLTADVKSGGNHTLTVVLTEEGTLQVSFE